MFQKNKIKNAEDRDKLLSVLKTKVILVFGPAKTRSEEMLLPQGLGCMSVKLASDLMVWWATYKNHYYAERQKIYIYIACLRFTSVREQCIPRIYSSTLSNLPLITHLFPWRETSQQALCQYYPPLSNVWHGSSQSELLATSSDTYLHAKFSLISVEVLPKNYTNEPPNLYEVLTLKKPPLFMQRLKRDW